MSVGMSPAGAHVTAQNGQSYFGGRADANMGGTGNLKKPSNDKGPKHVNAQDGGNYFGTKSAKNKAIDAAFAAATKKMGKVESNPLKRAGEGFLDGLKNSGDAFKRGDILGGIGNAIASPFKAIGGLFGIK